VAWQANMPANPDIDFTTDAERSGCSMSTAII
jgi:hypothetical protein